MVRFIALDGIRVLDECGDPVDDVISRPLWTALLAFLTFGRPIGPQRRDRLAALFWPEHSHDSARHSLCQAVYGLRRCLGCDLIGSRGTEEVFVDRTRVASDVEEFWAAVEAEDHVRAVGVHRSPLMQFFHLRQAGEFERWLDDEQRVLVETAFRSTRRLVDRALTEGDCAGALRWAQAALKLRPFSEAAARWVMALLAFEGRRVEALQLYRTYAFRLGEDLDLEPGPRTLELVGRIRAGSLGGDPFEQLRTGAGSLRLD
jgi:DNA-binding SARP family transcriptional activator